MPSAGVSWVLPPKGISTVPRPMVLSKRSDKPFSLHTFKRPKLASQADSKSAAAVTSAGTCSKTFSAFSSATVTLVCWATPLVSRKARDKSTILSPRQNITKRGSAVTSATTVASRFSSSAYLIKASRLAASITTAMRSWDSEIASSVPSKPSYFLGTLSKSITRPSVSSPIATETPPAPKSLQRLIIAVTAGLRNKR